MTIQIENQRRDGKYPVAIIFHGAPNAFGGSYPSRVFRKLYTPEKLREQLAKYNTPKQRKHYTMPA